MLTAAEIDKLPAKGDFPNSLLRRVFGKKHGHVITGRFSAPRRWVDDVDGGKKLEDSVRVYDRSYVGNRRQWLESLRNPLKPLPKKAGLEQVPDFAPGIPGRTIWQRVKGWFWSLFRKRKTQ